MGAREEGLVRTHPLRDEGGVGAGGGGDGGGGEQPLGPLLSLSLRVRGCTYSAHPRELGVQPSEQGPPAGAGALGTVVHGLSGERLRTRGEWLAAGAW